GSDKLVDGLLDHRFEAGVLVGAVIGGEDALMLALGRGRGRRLFRSGRDRSDGLGPRDRGGAAGAHEAKRNSKRSAAAARAATLPLSCTPVHGNLRQFSSAISICSGRLAAMRGPLRSSTQPRTRTRRFSSVLSC